MKKIIFTVFVLLIVHCTLNIENCMCQWVQMSNGMGTTQYVRCFTANGTYIFAATGGNGVFRSTNNGGNWMAINSGIPSLFMKSLLLNGINLFAGNSHGVYRSTNYGDNWSAALTGLPDNDINSFAVIGLNLFATSDYHGVYRSTDNGGSWTLTGLNNQNIGKLAVSGTNLFVAMTENLLAIDKEDLFFTDIGGVNRSTDYGRTWTYLNNGLPAHGVYALLVSGTNIFAGIYQSGVYLSTNNGESWTSIGLSNQNVWSLAVNGTNLFAGTSNGIYLSTNNGGNWLNKNQGFTTIPAVRSLLIANNYIFAGTDNSNSVWRRLYSEAIGIKQISENIPSSFSLSQNYPNPFNPNTNIRYQITNSLPRQVNLKIFDILGKEVATLVNEKQSPGTYEVDWNASQYPSGVYFYKLQSGDFVDTKRMILVK